MTHGMTRDLTERVALLALSLLVSSIALAESGGDSKGERNLAARSKLPRGKGLASAFRSDRDIASHEAVIFAEDFESGRIEAKHNGPRWDSARNRDTVLSLVDPAEPKGEPHVLGAKALQVRATLGENTGGGLTKWFESAPTLFFRFYVKFDPTCDYVHHFATLRANKSLRGKDRWSGFGGAGLKPQGDERFSTALEPWGDWGRRPPPGRWNFYTYWHEMEPSRDGKYWGNAFRPAEQKDIRRGEWICAEFMLRHNTPGKADGEQAFWIDGELRGHWSGICWRRSPTLWANAFTLEAYITDRWTKNRNNTVYFDNVVIAREYIGPAGTGRAKKLGDRSEKKSTQRRRDEPNAKVRSRSPNERRP